MTIDDIIRLRIVNEHAAGMPLHSPEEVVRHLVAVQSQDYPGAKWALGQRIGHITDAQIDEAFDQGRILRTHIMRPTWHFVTPEDIKWLLELTSPRVNQLNKYYYNKLGLTNAIFKRGHDVLVKELQDHNYKTRQELSDALHKAGIDTVGMSLRYPYILSEAELAGLICSGPRRGKQQTYALLDERAPHAKKLARDEALVELTRRYFASHGPALLHDFAWWSGLALTDIKRGVHEAGLLSTDVDGKTYWHTPIATLPRIKSPQVWLLPNYDELIVAYKNHTGVIASELRKAIGSRPIVVANHVVMLDGKIIGGWRRTVKAKQVILDFILLAKFNKAQREAFDKAVAEYSKFMNLPVVCNFSD